MNSKAYFVQGARTAMAEYVGSPQGGKFYGLTAIELGALAAKEALLRSKVDPALIDHVIVGNVLQTSVDAIYGARHVGLRAELPEHVPALTVNRLCGSGLEAVASASRLINCGEAKFAIAGGVENMSQAPHVLRGARRGFALGQGNLEDSLMASLKDPFCDLFMAQTAEKLASDFSISRVEQDEYALESTQRALQAQEAGILAKEIHPVSVKLGKKSFIVDSDDHLRPDSTIEQLQKLRPAFGKDGSVTAGNASGIVDGGAAIVLCHESEREGLDCLGRFVDQVSIGVDPTRMGIGPVPAIQKLLNRNKLAIADIGRFEINEAFAAQYLAVEKELRLDRSKVNVNGGAIALGHPLGMTGLRLIHTLLLEMKRHEIQFGVAAACIGGGQGIAVLVENT